MRGGGTPTYFAVLLGMTGGKASPEERPVARRTLVENVVLVVLMAEVHHSQIPGSPHLANFLLWVRPLPHGVPDVLRIGN